MFGLLLPTVRPPVAFIESVAYMPVFYIPQVAHSQPFIKFQTVRFSLYSATKAEVNHGVENDAG